MRDAAGGEGGDAAAGEDADGERERPLKRRVIAFE
jgi:hypothetical protein